MEKSIKISIIIPVYNAGGYLKECIDSVLAQSLQEIEVICIDDGSADESLGILKEYGLKDKRVTVIGKENSGYGNTVNLGIYKATGEYIGIVEPDDYINLNMFETLYTAADRHGLDIVSSDYNWFYDNEGKRIFERHPIYDDFSLYNKIWNPERNIKIIQGHFINPAGLFKRKFLLDKQILHNETPGAAFQDRGFFFLSIIQAERVMTLPYEFYNYRHDNPNSSIAGRDDMQKVITEYRLVLKKLLKMDAKYKKFLPEHFRREYGSCRYALSRSCNHVQRKALHMICEEFNDYKRKGILDITGMDAELKKELQLIMEQPEKAYDSLISLENEIHDKLADFDQFLIYGAGGVGKRIFQKLNDMDKMKCKGFAVSDKSPQSHFIENYPIKCIEEYVDIRREVAVIVAVTDKWRNELMETLSRLGFCNVIIPQSLAANL